jgi:hypothetical protein
MYVHVRKNKPTHNLFNRKMVCIYKHADIVLGNTGIDKKQYQVVMTRVLPSNYKTEKIDSFYSTMVVQLFGKQKMQSLILCKRELTVLF